VTDFTAFQDFVRTRLKDAGLTKAQLDDVMGVPRGTTSQMLEPGRTRRALPSSDALRRAAAALGSTLFELVTMGLGIDPQELINDVQTLAAYTAPGSPVSGLSARDRAAVLDFIAYIRHRAEQQHTSSKGNRLVGVTNAHRPPELP